MYLHILTEKGKGGEREGEKHQCEIHLPAASHTRANRNPAHNPGSHPDRESNLQPFALQDNAQQTETHQSGW